MPRKCLWDRYSLGTRLSAISHFFFLSLKTVPEVFAKVYSAQFFLVSKQGNWKALDSKTRTSTSTRFELKFFRVFSKYRLPGKLQFTIFHQKSSHCYL